jgi:hypothetical protein
MLGKEKTMGVTEVSSSDGAASFASAPAQAREAAGQSWTPGADAGVVHAPPAPREAPPPPVGDEPHVAAKDLFHADGILGFAFGSHPVNTEQPLIPANDKPGVVASERVNISVTHTTTDGHFVIAAGGLNVRESSLPGASAVGYTGSATVGHDFDPLLQFGVVGTLHGSNPLDVKKGDPKDEPAGYRFAQIAATADSKDTLAGGGKIVAHAEAGYRFGPGYTNRVNVAAQGTVTEPVGPVQLKITGGATPAVWTDPTPKGQPRRLDVSGNLGVNASIPVGDSGVRAFAEVGFDGRVSSQADGHNYGNVGIGVGIQYSTDGSSNGKPRPKN